MAKRFTSTEKWQDPWFCRLSNTDKLFWIYILDNCNHAGIWQVNMMLVRTYFGNDFELPDFKSRIVKLSREKWFIPKFIEFQYGTLDRINRAHKSVIQILEKEGAYKVLGRGLNGRKDKDTDTEKDTDMDKDTDKEYVSGAY